MNRKLINIIQAFIPVPLLTKIQSHRNKDTRPQIIYNLGIDVKDQPKVLFSYLPDFLYMEKWGAQYGTRHVECAAFVKALLDKGCRVDLTSCDNVDGIRADYDYIFGFGKAFRKARELNPKAKTVLYLTEKTPDFSYKKEQERIDYFKERHNKKVKATRSGKYFTNDDFYKLDQCIMIGHPRDIKLLPNAVKGFTINPTGLKNQKYNCTFLRKTDARKNFLWIGSLGAVHKGLDLLLDIFAKHPDLTLHIAGLHWSEKSLLHPYFSVNVIDHGYMNIQTKEFFNIVQQCAFCLSPSCSEGVSTSVITAMNHGLIPLVSQECSIELDGIGETMTDFHIEYIEKIIEKWSNMDDQTLEKQQRLVLELVKSKYTIENYSTRIHEIINEIIE